MQPAPPSFQLTTLAIAAIRARQQEGVKLIEVAAIIGVHPATLSRWLHQKKRIYADTPEARRLAAWLKLRYADCVEPIEAR